MLLLTDFGSRGHPNVRGTLGPVMGTLSKLAHSVHSGQFSMLLLTNFGFQGDPNIPLTSRTGYTDIVKTRRFGPFWPVFYAITH